MENGKSLFDEAVLLNVTFHAFGSSKRLKKDQYEVDADKEKTGATKQICQSKELLAILNYQAKMRKWITDRTIPGYAGLCAVKIQAVPVFEEYFQACVLEFAQLVDAFIAQYPKLKERDSLPKEQGGLGSLYDESNYPSERKVRESFGFEWDYKEIGAPGRLKTIDSVLYEKMERVCKEQLSNAVEEGKAWIRGQFLEQAQGLQEKLTGTRDNGKPKIFKDTFVPRIKEWIDSFSMRNYGDAELEPLVKQLADSLEGVSSADLRNSDFVRNKVQQTTTVILSAMDGMLISKPKRRIMTEEE